MARAKIKYHPITHLQYWADRLEDIAEIQCSVDEKDHPLTLEECDILTAVSSFLRTLSVGEAEIG